MKATEILTKVNTKYGAPMGRHNVGHEPFVITSGPTCRVFKCNQTKVYQKTVHLDQGGYDIGGAYWGIGSQLIVRFTKDLTFIQYSRLI